MNRTTETPLGIVNNNPLNIVQNPKNNWVGQKKSKGRFCVFEEMKWGYRAACMLLKKYINVYKCDTVRLVVSKWAPPHENNTGNYINFVARYAEVNPDDKISFKNQVQMFLIISAMTQMECGKLYNPMVDNSLWQAMYEGYIMARDNISDFKTLADASPSTAVALTA